MSKSGLGGGVAGGLLQGLRGWCRNRSAFLAQLWRAVECIWGYGRSSPSVSCTSSVAILLVARHLQGPRLWLVWLVWRVFVGIGRRVGHCKRSCRLDD